MSVFRVLFIWLVMLALPLQGLAAASMQNCTGTSGTVNASSAHHGDSAHLDSAHHGDSGMHVHHAAEVAAQAADPAEASSDASGSAHKCTLCALCGHGVALNEFPTPLEFGEQAHASPRDPTVLIPAVAVLVPDKPPRA